MNISKEGLDLIKEFEGCRLTAYKAIPSEKHFTIGWGHYGADVYQGQTITQEYADSLLLTDLQRYVSAVRECKLAFIPSQNQFDALVSFCYNLGTGIMYDFTAMSAEQVSKEIPLYNRGGGQVLEGLVRRRKAEQDLFNKDLYIPSSPATYQKHYYETGTFYATELIYFRDYPSTSFSTPIAGHYSPEEYVHYDQVVWNDGHIWISWKSASTGIRRYLPIRELKNNIPQEMWGYIE